MWHTISIDARYRQWEHLRHEVGTSPFWSFSRPPIVVALLNMTLAREWSRTSSVFRDRRINSGDLQGPTQLNCFFPVSNELFFKSLADISRSVGVRSVRFSAVS